MPYSKNIHLQVGGGWEGGNGEVGSRARLHHQQLVACRPTMPSMPHPELPATQLLATHPQGHITTNGVPLQSSKLRAGFVQQDDLFYPQAWGGAGARAGWCGGGPRVVKSRGWFAVPAAAATSLAVAQAEQPAGPRIIPRQWALPPPHS